MNYKKRITFKKLFESFTNKTSLLWLNSIHCIGFSVFQIGWILERLRMRRFFSFQTMLLSNNTLFPPLSLSMIFFRGHLVVSTILIPSIWRSPDKSRYTLYHFLFSLSLWHIVNTAIRCLFWYVVYFVFRIVCYDLILIWCS